MPQVNRKSLIAMLFLLPLLVTGLVSTRASSQGKRNRVIEKPFQPDEPVEIVDIQIGSSLLNKQAASFGNPLLAEDDWVKGLAFEVKNTSTKRITYMEVDLDVRKSENSRVGITLRYGRMPPLPGESETRPAVTPIDVGGTVKLVLEDVHYDAFMNLLREQRGSSLFDRLEVRIGAVIFEDESMWYKGRILRRDPANPLRWKPTPNPASRNNSRQRESVASLRTKGW